MNFGPRAAIALLVIGFCSCGNKLQTREAVEKGIRKGVSDRGVNVDAMDVTVGNVSFHGNQADATVSFTPKGGKLSDGLTMRYTLEQREGQWVIVGRSQMDMSKHAGSTQTPGAATGSGPDNQAGNPAPAASRALPPGHPAVDGTAK